MKERIIQLKNELKGHDQKIEALTSEMAYHIEQVQTREAKAMLAKESLKEAKFMRDVEVASAIAEALVKFKESKEFTALLKNDYHNGYDVGEVEIFYNIWAKYQDLDYMFSG